MKKIIIKILSFLYYSRIRMGLPKDDLTIFSNDCTGGVIYHQIGKRFCSPFINLYLDTIDFIYLVEHAKEYLSVELVQCDFDSPFPVGVLEPFGLKGIKIYFLHYHSFEEAKQKWSDRCRRIVWDRVYIIANLSNKYEEDYSNNVFSLWNDLNINVYTPKNYLLLLRKGDFVSIPDYSYQINFKKQPFEIAHIIKPYFHGIKRPIDQICYRRFFK